MSFAKLLVIATVFSLCSAFFTPLRPVAVKKLGLSSRISRSRRHVMLSTAEQTESVSGATFKNQHEPIEEVLVRATAESQRLSKENDANESRAVAQQRKLQTKLDDSLEKVAPVILGTFGLGALAACRMNLIKRKELELEMEKIKAEQNRIRSKEAQVRIEIKQAASLSEETDKRPTETAISAYSYIDDIADKCHPDKQTSECAIAISSYLQILSTGKVKETPFGVATISSYFDALSRGCSAISSGPAVSSYMKAVLSGEVASPTPEAVVSYLDALSMGEVAPPLSGTGIATFLQITAYLDDISEKCDAEKATGECATAITSYLDAPSARKAWPMPSGEAAISSYLDALSTGSTAPSGDGMKSYVDTVESLLVSAPAVSSYIEAVSSGEVAAPTSETLGSFLDSLSTGEIAPPLSGAGIATYLDNVSTGLTQTCGAGITTYLDAISEKCDAKKATVECATAITSYLDAVSSGQARPAPSGAAAISSYLDALSTGSTAPSEVGMQSYVDSVAGVESPIVSAPAGNSYIDAVSSGEAAAGITTYLDHISENCDAAQATVECATAITSYLDALSTGQARPTPSGEAAISSYLDALSTGFAPSGVGMQSYVDTVAGAESPIVSAPLVSSYMDFASSGEAAAPLPGPVGSFLDALSTRKVAPPLSGAGIATYLDTVSTGLTQTSGAGIYLDAISEKCDEEKAAGVVAMPSFEASTPLAGSYLDEISSACNAGVPSPDCAAAITSYLGGLSTGTDKPSSECAAALVSYLDALNSSGSDHSFSSEDAVTSFLDALASGAVDGPSSEAVASYLDSLSSGAIAKPSSAASIATNLLADSSAPVSSLLPFSPQ